MPRRRLLPLCLLAACGADPQPDAGTDARPDAAVAPDAAVRDAAPAPDAEVAPDAEAPDAEVPDAGQPAPAITTASLPFGVVGSPYMVALTADDGERPLVWSASGLPPGVSVNGASLAGVPAAAGDFTVELVVEDASARTDRRSLTLAVVEPLEIVTVSLPAGRVPLVYSATVAAQGGRPPLGWSVASGALPPGIGLANGGLFGRPSAGGDFDFTIEVTDTFGLTATAAFSLHVTGALELQTAALPAAQVGEPYAATITAAGGIPSYTWSLDEAPAWLVLIDLDPQDAIVELAGTPAAEGSFPVRVSLGDSDGYLATALLTLDVAPPYAITAPPATAVIAAPFSWTFTTANGTAPHTFTLDAGMLPAGLVLTADGRIEGTPLESGTFPLTIAAIDAAGRDATLDVVLEVINDLTIDVSLWISQAQYVDPFSASVAASGGLGSFSWSITGANPLPAGLTLGANGAIATISGAPAAAGTFSFTIAVDDGDVTRTAPLSLEVTNTFRIVTTPLPPGMTGVAYSAQLQAEAGQAPYSFTIASGALPPGLTLDASGALSGAPAAPGTFNFVARATDAFSTMVTAPLAITVDTLTITPGPQPQALIGQPYAWDLTASTGTAPHTWSITSGALPLGLSIIATGPSSARIEGVPADTGLFAFTIEVTDALGATGELAATIEVPQVRITTVTLPAVTFPYSAIIEAEEGVPPYAWAHTLGDLPPGWTLTSAGVDATLSGGTFYGRYTFEITVTDQLGDSDVQRYSILGLPAADPERPLWPVPHLTRVSAEFAVYTTTVTDPLTGLEWIRSWASAPTFVDARAHCASRVDGGHLDWRVPTFVELASIADPYLEYLPNVFTGPNVESLWSSTPAPGGGQVRLHPYLGAGHATVCVRAAPVPDTPQYVSVRGSAHDQFTGLMWSSALSEVAGSFDNYWGQGYCERLDASGFSDWRAPTVRELASVYGPGTLSYHGQCMLGHSDSGVLDPEGFVRDPRIARQHCVREVQTGCTPPIASLSASATIAPAGHVLILDASASTTSGPCPPQYTWSISGPGVAPSFAYAQNSRTEPTLAIIPGRGGSYTVTLTITVDGVQASDTRTIAVTEDPSCTWVGTARGGGPGGLQADTQGGTPPISYYYVTYFDPLTDSTSTVRGSGRDFHASGFISANVYSFGCSSFFVYEYFAATVVMRDGMGCSDVAAAFADCD